MAWVKLRSDKLVLYGFIFYSDADTAIVEYVNLSFTEVDHLAGPECLVFVIEAPSMQWIETAYRANYPFLQVLSDLKPISSQSQNSDVSGGQGTITALLSIILQNPQLCVFHLKQGENVGVQHLLSPQYRIPYNRAEIWEVARFFNIKASEVPCLVLFQHLDAGEIWLLDLTHIESAHQAAIYFRKAFESKIFQEILRGARTFSQKVG
jgi:hypothetical protein